MQVFCVFYLYASFFYDIQQVKACLSQEFLICYFFGVVVPVPDFYTVVGAVAEDGFAF